MTPKKIIKSLSLKNTYYLWVILLFSSVTLFFNKAIAIFELTVFAVLFFNYVFVYVREEKKFSEYVNNLSLSVEKASHDSIFNFVIPVVILKSSGSIVWYNDEFYKLISTSQTENKNYAYEKNIKECIDVFPNKFESKSLSKISFELEYKQHYYHIFGNTTKVDFSDESLTILYFEDRTDNENLKKRYVNEKFVSSVIVCDNYDDVIQDTPVSERPMLIATLDNLISEFSNEVNGVLKKQEKDRYFFYFQRRYLDKFEENKFEILINKVGILFL